jgi:hypothetical protein
MRRLAPRTAREYSANCITLSTTDFAGSGQLRREMQAASSARLYQRADKVMS